MLEYSLSLFMPPTVEPLVIQLPIQHLSVTASSERPGGDCLASFTIDGKRGAPVCTSNSDDSPWLQYDMGHHYEVHSVRVSSG